MFSFGLCPQRSSGDVVLDLVEPLKHLLIGVYRSEDDMSGRRQCMAQVLVDQMGQNAPRNARDVPVVFGLLPRHELRARSTPVSG
jgi:hypothetical protein